VSRADPAIIRVLIGCAQVGALLAGRTADWIGRKRTIQLGSIIAIVGERSAEALAKYQLTSYLRMHAPDSGSRCRHAHRRPVRCRFLHRRSEYDRPNVPGEPVEVIVASSKVDDLNTQAEISPPHARGLLSGMTQWMISWGFFIANWIGYGCGYLKSTAQFRLPLGIQIVPAVLLLLWVTFRLLLFALVSSRSHFGPRR
jgi:MFS family permease